jgi:hypothetical protein
MCKMHLMQKVKGVFFLSTKYIFNILVGSYIVQNFKFYLSHMYFLRNNSSKAFHLILQRDHDDATKL